MSLDYTELIWIKQNSLTKEFCNHLIDKFENDNRKNKGVTLKGLDENLKLTTDLSITKNSNWEDEDALIQKTLSSSISEYQKYSSELNSKRLFFGPPYNFLDSGYKIQKYLLDESGEKTGFYDWHSDFSIDGNGTRVLVFMWYLNDVEQGGETEFCNGLKIKPEAGKMVIFPASWYIVHRGNKPISNDKLICNGWLYARR